MNWRILVWTGGILVGVVALMAIAAPLIAPWDPIQIDPLAIRQPPGGDHLLGTDANGMDVFSRLLYAARGDLLLALSAVGLAVVAGSAIGVFSGYVGGRTDTVIMRILEVIQSIPTLILELAFAGFMRPGLVNLTLVIAFISVPSYARLTRAEVRTVREMPYIEAAKTAGLPTTKILTRHVLPNSLSPVWVVAPLNVGWAMLALAGLSFLGLGVPVPEPEWGGMISQGMTDIVSGRLWTSVPPGLALVICVLGFSLIGEGLQQREVARRTR